MRAGARLKATRYDTATSVRGRIGDARIPSGPIGARPDELELPEAGIGMPNSRSRVYRVVRPTPRARAAAGTFHPASRQAPTIRSRSLPNEGGPMAPAPRRMLS